MTNKEKCEAIAKACGWVVSMSYRPEGGTVPCYRNSNGFPFKELPDYFSDPRLCFEAFETLGVKPIIERDGGSWVVLIDDDSKLPEDLIDAKDVSASAAMAEALWKCVYD